MVVEEIPLPVSSEMVLGHVLEMLLWGSVLDKRAMPLRRARPAVLGWPSRWKSTMRGICTGVGRSRALLSREVRLQAGVMKRPFPVLLTSDLLLLRTLLSDNTCETQIVYA